MIVINIMKSRINKIEYTYNSQRMGKFWCKNGEPHRERDLPATIRNNGIMQWCINGLMHRDSNNPAFINLKNNYMEYWNNGEFIRSDLSRVPASISILQF